MFIGDNRIFDIVVATGFLLPFVLGLFWGAPLLAGEYEQGTNRLAWTQSVPRLRWLAVKLAWVLGAAIVLTGTLTALTTWWYGPVNAVQHQRLGSAVFDAMGITPIGYAVFAVALGVIAGALWRRTVPAMATTLFAYGITRYLVDNYLRPNLLARTALLAADASHLPAANSGVILGTTLLNAAGRAIPIGKIQPADLPAACHRLSDHALSRCLTSHGFHLLISYQPANRYWPLQAIETASYIAIGGILLGLTFRIVQRRDG